MAQTILIELKAQDNASAQVKKTEQAVENLGKKTTKMTQDMGHGATDVMGQLDALGNRFRYMSIVVGTLAVGSVMMMKGLVDAAREGEQAFLKLGIFAVSMGEDMDATNKVARELAGTGLISVAEAAESLSSFLATGLGLQKSTDLMWTFLNSASVAKTVLTDTVGMALNKAAVGFRTLREVQIDNAGIQAVLNNVWKDYADTIGTTSKKLTESQKYEAMYIYYMKEGARFTGAATLVQNTFSGSLARLNAQFYQMKVSLGNTLIPLVGTLADLFTWVTSKISAFATSSSAMTSIVLVGVTALSVLAAAIAMVGAMLPMLVSGFVVLNWTAIAPMIATGATVIGVFLGISVAIGTLTYFILKATGQWDKWKNTIASMPDKIKAMINPMSTLGKTTLEADEKLAKSLKTLQQNIKLATRDFQEGMSEWAKKHDETVTDLKKQIGDLEKEYKIATDKIRQSFTDTMSDLSLAHARKTEDLQREIAEEVSKGIWADQTRIRELQLSLKRENEDYARSGEVNLATKDEQLEEEQIKYEERLLKLKTQLDEELVLEKKHANEVAQARTWVILDEIEKRNRAYSERLVQYQDELIELQKNATGQVSAIDQVAAAAKNAADQANAGVDELARKTNAVKTKAEEFANSWQSAGASVTRVITERIFPILESLGSKITSVGNKIQTFLFGSLPTQVSTTYQPTNWSTSPMISFFRGLLGFQEGGIVPGATGQAMPILAHGGETVLPVGASPITVNINNPSVRSSSDITMLANAVKDVLSRQQMLRHLK